MFSNKNRFPAESGFWFWIHKILFQQKLFSRQKAAFGFGSTKCLSLRTITPLQKAFGLWSTRIIIPTETNFPQKTAFGFGSTNCHSSKKQFPDKSVFGYKLSFQQKLISHQKLHLVLDPQNFIPTKSSFPLKAAFGFGSTKCHSSKRQFPAKSGLWFWIHKMSFQQNLVSRQKRLLVQDSKHVILTKTSFMPKSGFWFWVLKKLFQQFVNCF